MAEVSPDYRRRGWRAMAIMTVLVGLAFWGAFAWWSADANAYATLAKFFKSPKCAATLTGDRLSIRPTDEIWLKHESVEDLVPDHGHIMHLFLLRTPGFNRIWHLHPDRTDTGTLKRSPSIDAGHYQVFADIVDKYGFPWTLVGAIDLPNVAGPAMTGDDSEGIAPTLTPTSDTTTSLLPDGTQVIWKRAAGPLKANVPMILKFEVEDKSGAPGQRFGTLHGDGRACRDHPRRPQRLRAHPSLGFGLDGLDDDGECRQPGLVVDGRHEDADREDRAGAIDAVWLSEAGALSHLPAISAPAVSRPRTSTRTCSNSAAYTSRCGGCRGRSATRATLTRAGLLHRRASRAFHSYQLERLRGFIGDPRDSEIRVLHLVRIAPGIAAVSAPATAHTSRRGRRS